MFKNGLKLGLICGVTCLVAGLTMAIWAITVTGSLGKELGYTGGVIGSITGFTLALFGYVLGKYRNEKK